jgi:transcriptional regulator with GAF, ATPase, and Fis domain
MERARLIVRDARGAATEVELADETTVGRENGNSIVLADPEVSRRHAVIRRDGDGRCLVTDLASANGTYLNGRRLVVPAILRGGDVIAVGSTKLTFVAEGADDADADRTSGDGESTSVRVTVEEGVLIGDSRAMHEVFDLVRKASASDLAVLIEGETGTGKELVARGIHASSRRVADPFLALNCAAMSEALLESELFGHCKGAFTGATHDRAGLFEAADGGTVFLDEIGEMPTAMQAKLLRALESFEITRVGESRPRRVDFRLLSATNRDLAAEAERGAFRSDLYYRIAAFPIRLPALRDRPEDIPPIAEALLGAACRRAGKRATRIEPDAMAALTRFHWPGNVRELKNEIERAVAVAAEGETIGLRLLSARLTSSRARAASPGAAPGGGGARSADVGGGAREDAGEPGELRSRTADFERQEILAVLERHGGKKGPAARELGLTYQGLVKKMRRLGLVD